MSETPVEQSRRHIREGEARIKRQIELLAELERDGHYEAAQRARELLATMTEFLVAARQHLLSEQQLQARRERERSTR
jgi:vacuolar-type H+-ATPase subunit H